MDEQGCVEKVDKSEEDEEEDEEEKAEGVTRVETEMGMELVEKGMEKGTDEEMGEAVDVRGCSALSDVSSDISPSPLYIPPHCC